MDMFVYIGIGLTLPRDEIGEAIDEMLDGRGVAVRKRESSF